MAYGLWHENQRANQSQQKLCSDHVLYAISYTLFSLTRYERRSMQPCPTDAIRHSRTFCSVAKHRTLRFGLTVELSRNPW
jgi:hypothetical protein